MTETAGDGTADVACTKTTFAEAFNSVALTLTGTTSVAAVTSGCMTAHIGDDMRIETWAKKAAGGTASMSIIVEEFDNADCTDSLGTITVRAADDISTDWAVYGDMIAAGDWDVDTSSYQVTIQEDGDDGVTTYVDSPHAHNTNPGKSTLPVCACTVDADVARACSSLLSSVSNPASAGGVNDVSFNYIGQAKHQDTAVLLSSGTAANNLDIRIDAGVAHCGWYDAGGTLRDANTSSLPFVEMTPVNVQCIKHARGDISGYLDATPFTVQHTAENALLESMGSTLYLGSDSSAACNHGYISNIRFNRRATK
jgi:hypothetical protein